MNIADLSLFLAVAQTGNLRAAAIAIHQSPSALSKGLRRLEQSINTTLFDRVGKTLKLNADGERLRLRAAQIVQLAEQTATEFRGVRAELHCRVAAPAILQWRFGAPLASTLAQRYPLSKIAFVQMFEDAAIAAVARGDVDLAFVTGVSVAAGLPADVESVALGAITMQLVASPNHPLALRAPKRARSKPNADGVTSIKVHTSEVLQHDFVCPNRSQFCGLERGARSDGWRDDQLPRRIRFWVEDMQVLMSLVAAAQALAYLPDFAVPNSGLVRLNVTDCDFQCVENTLLIWRPNAASGWHQHVAEQLPLMV